MAGHHIPAMQPNTDAGQRTQPAPIQSATGGYVASVPQPPPPPPHQWPVCLQNTNPLATTTPFQHINNPAFPNNNIEPFNKVVSYLTFPQQGGVNPLILPWFFPDFNSSTLPNLDHLAAPPPVNGVYHQPENDNNHIGSVQQGTLPPLPPFNLYPLEQIAQNCNTMTTSNQFVAVQPVHLNPPQNNNSSLSAPSSVHIGQNQMAAKNVGNFSSICNTQKGAQAANITNAATYPHPPMTEAKQQQQQQQQVIEKKECDEMKDFTRNAMPDEQLRELADKWGCCVREAMDILRLGIRSGMLKRGDVAEMLVDFQNGADHVRQEEMVDDEDDEDNDDNDEDMNASSPATAAIVEKEEQAKQELVQGKLELTMMHAAVMKGKEVNTRDDEMSDELTMMPPPPNNTKVRQNTVTNDIITSSNDESAEQHDNDENGNTKLDGATLSKQNADMAMMNDDGDNDGDASMMYDGIELNAIKCNSNSAKKNMPITLMGDESTKIANSELNEDVKEEEEEDEGDQMEMVKFKPEIYQQQQHDDDDDDDDDDNDDDNVDKLLSFGKGAVTMMGFESNEKVAFKSQAMSRSPQTTAKVTGLSAKPSGGVLKTAMDSTSASKKSGVQRSKASGAVDHIRQAKQGTQTKEESEAKADQPRPDAPKKTDDELPETSMNRLQAKSLSAGRGNAEQPSALDTFRPTHNANADHHSGAPAAGGGNGGDANRVQALPTENSNDENTQIYQSGGVKSARLKPAIVRQFQLGEEEEEEMKDNELDEQSQSNKARLTRRQLIRCIAWARKYHPKLASYYENELGQLCIEESHAVQTPDGWFGVTWRFRKQESEWKIHEFDFDKTLMYQKHCEWKMRCGDAWLQQYGLHHVPWEYFADKQFVSGLDCPSLSYDGHRFYI